MSGCVFQLHSPRIERASVWAGRESCLSLAEGTCTLIRPKVQPCGWKRYVRTDCRDSRFNESHKRLYSASASLYFWLPPLVTPHTSRIILALPQPFAFIISQCQSAFEVFHWVQNLFRFLLTLCLAYVGGDGNLVNHVSQNRPGFDFFNLSLVCQLAGDVTRADRKTHGGHQTQTLYGLVPANFFIKRGEWG